MIHKTSTKPEFQGISAQYSKETEYISPTPHRPVQKWWYYTGIFLEEISSTDQDQPRKLHVAVTFWYST